MSERFKQQRWSLKELFTAPSAPEVKGAMESLEEHMSAFEGFRQDLSEDLEAEKLLEILQHYEEGAKQVKRLLYYGHLHFAEDTQDQEAQTFLGRAQQLAAQLENRSLFFKLWWKGLEEQQAERLMADAGDYRYWLEALRLERPYTLSEPEEKIINTKDVNGPLALVNIYNSITNRYTFELEVDGEVRELTRGELQVYYRHPDPALRAGAYQALHRVYENDAPVLGQIYQYRVRDWRSENVEVRGYSSPISVRNLGNNVPDEVVDALLEACRANVSIFQRFFQLKAEWLRMDKIRRYDIYAPVVETEKTYAFGDAVEMILESFRGFDRRFVDSARKVIEQRHLDSEVRKGKQSGAFCATVIPDLTPWVLTSYQGKPDDVATLAHELGHAIHSLVSDHHTALTHDASLPLAETASTFAEMLLVDHLLEEDPDPAVQRDLLFRQMDDAYATIMRQAYFASFERTAHDLIHEGASVADLSEAYLENIRSQFGDSLNLSEDFRFEWIEIPHFYHTPFYVYAYAFGQLLVLALYQQYQQEGESFKPRYIDILAAGGSDAPVRILDRAGVDVRSPEFWQGGFDVLDTSLGHLEALKVER
jgi:oligoendopeptidase F